MNDLKIFNFEEFKIRTIFIEDVPYFVVVDICNILCLTNITETLKRVDEDDLSQTEVVDSLNRKQKSYIVNESGLYALILLSKRPEAKKFKKWITSEVLPSIRKTGSYQLKQKSDDEIIAFGYQKAMEKIQDLTVENIELKEENISLKKQIEVPSKTMRAEINQLVRRKSVRENLNYGSVWLLLYQEFHYRYHINLQTRARNNDMSVLEYCEMDGWLSKLYFLAKELFDKNEIKGEITV